MLVHRAQIDRMARQEREGVATRNEKDNGRRHGPMAGRQGLASNLIARWPVARSKAVCSAINSHALGGLKSGWVVANSTGRQTGVSERNSSKLFH